MCLYVCTSKIHSWRINFTHTHNHIIIISYETALCTYVAVSTIHIYMYNTYIYYVCVCIHFLLQRLASQNQRLVWRYKEMKNELSETRELLETLELKLSLYNPSFPLYAD